MSHTLTRLSRPAARHASPVGAERDRLDPAAVAAEHQQTLAGGAVPDSYRQVAAGAGDARSIGADRDVADAAGVAGENIDVPWDIEAFAAGDGIRGKHFVEFALRRLEDADAVVARPATTIFLPSAANCMASPRLPIRQAQQPLPGGDAPDLGVGSVGRAFLDTDGRQAAAVGAEGQPHHPRPRPGR
jgi:hypothetical protein